MKENNVKFKFDNNKNHWPSSGCLRFGAGIDDDDDVPIGATPEMLMVPGTIVAFVEFNVAWGCVACDWRSWVGDWFNCVDLW